MKSDVTEAVGSAVRDLAPGDDVYFCRGPFGGHLGTYAEYAVIDGRYCGACHDGQTAWSIDNCDLCHSGKPGMNTRVHNSTMERLVTPSGALGR